MIQLAFLIAAITYTVDASAAVVTITAALVAAGVAASTAATIAAVAAFAINMAVAFVISKVLTPNNTSAGANQDQGVRLQVPPDPTRAIPVVYGDAYIGGKFVDAVLSTDSSQMFYVMAISCISADGQLTYGKNKFYYGDRLVTFDTTDPSKVISLTDGAGNVDTKIAGYLNIYLFRSTPAGVISNLDVGGTSAGTATPQNVMSVANGVPSGQEWAASGRQMNGLAFAIIKLTYNRDAETTQLQPLTFYVQHNLRSTGVAKAGDVWYDYMTNIIYGAAVDPAYVDYASAVALNIYSDQLIEFRDQGGTLYTQSRYRINGVLDTNANVLQNVDQIMTASDSWMTYQEVSGKWAIVINKAEGASFAFDDSNIIGSITVGGMDITTSVNQIEGRFPEGANRDQFNYVYIETPAGILYPNEPINKTNVNYDLVNNNVQAYYLANRILEQAREDLNVTINTTYVGIQVNAGDVVSMTNSYYGWNNKLFRVMQVREASLPDGNLGAQIQMAEYSSAVYDNFDITKYAPVPNSELVAGGYFSPLSAPSIIDAFPDAIVPNFDVRATVPATGRVTAVFLYYTLSATPTADQWALLDSQVLSDSSTLTPSSTFDFDDISLPAANYYFAFKVGNNIAQSELSPSTPVFNWNPTGNAGTNAFVGSFSPSSVLVPFDGTTADFSAAVTNLNGVSTLGQVQYVTAATDSAGTFVANTWRIGGSSTTGTGDIVKTNITIGNPTVSGLSALFPVPTAMSSSSAKVTVPIRYKNGSNQVFQIATQSVQYVYATKGSSARICYTKTTLSSLDPTPATITTSGSASFPPNNSWGTGTVWQATPPAIVASESVYQSDGIYSPTTGNTVWNVPYLSALKVGSLSAISANLGTITAGSITGAIIKTAATGKRVEMTGTTNDFNVYDASNTLIASLGGASNSLYVVAETSLQPAGLVINNSNFVPAFSGRNDTTSNTGDSCAGVRGNGTAANGVVGISTLTGIGVVGRAQVTGGTNHGVKGFNIATSGTIATTTSGLVGTSIGYDFYADGNGVNYGPFTGAHDALVPIGQNIPQGYICVDVKCIVKKNISNTLFEVAMSSTSNQVPIGIMVLNNGSLADQVPASFVEKIEYTEIDGHEISNVVLYPEYDMYKNDYDYCAANAVGEGQVYVCGESGNIVAGDLIVTSSTAGVGMKQSDNIVKNITVAKAREAITFASPTEVKLVACIYLCG